MRQLTIKTVFFLLLCTGMSLLNAQVTIKKSNFPVQPGTDIYYSKSNTDIATPSEGPNQVWDYSGIPLGTQFSSQNEDATNDPDIPNASIRVLGNLNFQGFKIPNYVYQSLDETGYKQVGLKSLDTTFPIDSITGGPNDVLRFPPIARPHEGGTGDLLRFPASYKDKWTDTYIAYTDFELTVGLFGLDQQPGVDKQYLTHTSEVVGYGELIIPLEDGTPSDPVEVLLIKSTTTRIDSFFLGGFPAPDALIGAFGTTQGAVTDLGVDYSFYTPDFPEVVLFISQDRYIYRPRGTQPQANLTITKANYPRRGDAIHTTHVSNPVVAAPPQEGLNQVWDYSYLETDSTFTSNYEDETNSSIFPNANLSTQGFLVFQNFSTPIRIYEEIDMQGVYTLGSTRQDASFSLLLLTGNPNDQLHFPSQVKILEGRIDELQFPLTYGKQWTQSQSETINFNLSVGAFGLDNAPVRKKNYFTETREVVGEGTIILPSANGTGTVSAEALLVKVESTVVDSFFLDIDNAPAFLLPTLLATFQVSQGQTKTAVNYRFYTPNYGLPIFDYFAEGDQSVFFRPNLAENLCGDGIQNGNETGIDCGGPCAPCGDLCINALPIQCGDMAIGNTLQYTNTDLMEACDKVDRTSDKAVNPDEGVWYTFVGTGEAMQFSTDHPQTNFDTNIQIFKGECRAQVCVAEDEDGGNNFVNGYTSSVVLNSLAGEIYYLYLSGFYGEQGNYKLTMNCYPPMVIQLKSTTNIPLRGGTTGSIDMTVSGGPCDGLMSFSWTGPGDFTATTEDISGLTHTGIYTLTVTDCLGNEEVIHVRISYSSRGRGRKADIETLTQLMAAPNPFTDETIIHFNVDTDEQVLLEVFDIRGASVATLFDGTAEGGQNYQVSFGTAMPTGTYIAKLTTANGEVQHIKLLLTK